AVISRVPPAPAPRTGSWWPMAPRSDRRAFSPTCGETCEKLHGWGSDNSPRWCGLPEECGQHESNDEQPEADEQEVVARLAARQHLEVVARDHEHAQGQAREHRDR